MKESSSYKWIVLGNIMIGTFMAVLDSTVVNTGLPVIMGTLGADINVAEWVLTGYMLSDEDIAMMARRDVKVIHCPRANLSNHGFPKTPQMLQAGLNVSLGCDGTAPSNLDLFDEMKALRYSMIAYWGLPFFNPMVMSLSHAS